MNLKEHTDLSLEGLIPEDESVRLLSHELDYTLLYQAYSAKGRNPAVDPKIEFSVIHLKTVKRAIHTFWRVCCVS